MARDEHKRFRPIADWGLFNWFLIPTVWVGRNPNGGGFWAYFTWLRGRIGFAYY